MAEGTARVLKIHIFFFVVFISNPRSDITLDIFFLNTHLVRAALKSKKSDEKKFAKFYEVLVFLVKVTSE